MRFIPIISKSQNIINICYDKSSKSHFIQKIHILIAYQGIISILNTIYCKIEMTIYLVNFCYLYLELTNVFKQNSKLSISSIILIVSIR